jgi:hypothetical protein
MKNRVVTFSTFAIILAIASRFLVPGLKAQEPQPGAQQSAPQQAPEGMKLEKLSQVLNLSPQQKSQLAPIVEAEAPKVQSIRKDPNLSGPEKAKKLEAVHGETDSLVKSILNPTQYKQWQQIRKVGVEHMKQGVGQQPR